MSDPLELELQASESHTLCVLRTELLPSAGSASPKSRSQLSSPGTSVFHFHRLNPCCWFTVFI